MSKLPRVAIIGRPNVGKSTLFNRIAGARRAIVDPVAGSTRDRHFHPVTWRDKDFEVVDTGGLFERPDNPLDQQVAAQVQLAVDEAEVVCWVVDGTTGMVPEDQALSRRLRPISERVVLVVNKIDHPSHESSGLEFHQLGFPDVFEMSAEHGLGVSELLDEIVARLSGEEKESPPEADETRVAIVGRPNVGKSSLLNRLVGEDRAVVNAQAGTTRDAVDTVIAVDDILYRFVDTAGIRRRSKTSSRADEIGVLYAERAIDRAHICLLVLDGQQGITREDASIGSTIADSGRGSVILFNKWDLVDDREVRAKELGKDVLDRLPHLDYSPIAFVSALTGRGVAGILPRVDRIHQVQQKRIPTPELNRFLRSVAGSHPPRAKDGKEVNLLYMTQSGVIPPRFLVFTNRFRGIEVAYPRFLVRKLREYYGFEGTPIRVTIRQKK